MRYKKVLINVRGPQRRKWSACQDDTLLVSWLGIAYICCCCWNHWAQTMRQLCIVYIQWTSRYAPQKGGWSVLLALCRLQSIVQSIKWVLPCYPQLCKLSATLWWVYQNQHSVYICCCWNHWATWSRLPLTNCQVVILSGTRMNPWVREVKKRQWKRGIEKRHHSLYRQHTLLSCSWCKLVTNGGVTVESHAHISTLHGSFLLGAYQGHLHMSKTSHKDINQERHDSAALTSQ